MSPTKRLIAPKGPALFTRPRPMIESGVHPTPSAGAGPSVMDNDALRWFRPGKKFERYELMCVLARGGMAVVWLARIRGKHGFEKLVALKTILPNYASDERFRQMFLDEARVASNIEHPNVAQILDLGEQGQTLYLVMEFVNGDSLQTLQKIVTGKNLLIPLNIACRIICDTCAGLHAAHEVRNSTGAALNVIHRDVSPHNIMLNTHGVAKVIDFGIAQARDRSAELDTSTGELKGKVLYMAPEQALGTDLDRRVDIWAIGAVFYYLLSNRTPLERGSQIATLNALIQGEPHRALPDEVPVQIRAIVDKALARDRELRFETAEQMQQAIEQAMMELRLSASHGEVAAFTREHFSEIDAQRRLNIEEALDDSDPTGSLRTSEDGPIAPKNDVSATPAAVAVVPAQKAVLKRWGFGLVAVLAVLTAAVVFVLTHRRPEAAQPTSLQPATLRPVQTAASPSAPILQATSAAPIAVSAAVPIAVTAKPADHPIKRFSPRPKPTSTKRDYGF